jgi:hypothetical protein
MQKHFVFLSAVLFLTGCGTKRVPQAALNDDSKALIASAWGGRVLSLPEILSGQGDGESGSP